MSYLSDRDFANIIEFSARINRNYPDFAGETLRALDELFHFRFSCYVVLNKDIHNTFFVQDVKSNTMWPVFQEQFKSRYYKEDGFLTVLPKLRFSMPDQHAFFWEDVAGSSKPSRDYLTLLSSHGIAYAALVGVSPSMYAPMHVMTVFKTANSGPFTPYERELLEYIGLTFSNSIKPYKTWLQTQHVLSATEHLFDSFPNGYGILSENGTLLYHNRKFLELTSAITGEPNLEQILKKLIPALPFPLGGTPRNQEYGKSFEREFDEITLSQKVEKHYFATGYEVLHYLSVAPKVQARVTAAATPLSSEMLLKYGFTVRETEVLRLLAHGSKSQEIAASLFVSESTVRSHIRNIYSKLGVSNRMELLAKLQPESAL